MSATSLNAPLQQFSSFNSLRPAPSRTILPINTVQQALFLGNVSTGPMSPLNMLIKNWILAPSGANQTWVMPTAFNILQAFSNSVRTGEVIELVVANRSQGFIGFLQGVTGAGMSSAGYSVVTLGTGASFPSGSYNEVPKTVFLEWNQVSTDGKTGSFLLY